MEPQVEYHILLSTTKEPIIGYIPQSKYIEWLAETNAGKDISIYDNEFGEYYTNKLRVESDLYFRDKKIVFAPSNKVVGMRFQEQVLHEDGAVTWEFID